MYSISPSHIRTYNMGCWRIVCEKPLFWALLTCIDLYWVYLQYVLVLTLVVGYRVPSVWLALCLQIRHASMCLKLKVVQPVGSTIPRQLILLLLYQLDLKTRQLLSLRHCAAYQTRLSQGQCHFRVLTKTPVFHQRIMNIRSGSVALYLLKCADRILGFALETIRSFMLSTILQCCPVPVLGFISPGAPSVRRSRRMSRQW